MTVKEIAEKVEEMIQDKNRMLNTPGAGSEIQRAAWKYARENLEYVLNLLRKAEEPRDGEISTSETKIPAISYTGLCQAKKKGCRDGAWFVGETATIDEKVFILVGTPEIADGKIGEWMEVERNTVQRFAGKEDVSGRPLFEGDVIGTEASKIVRMEICYGRYGAFCPNDREYMENIGFFVVSNTTGDAMPLGPTENYAHWLGNIVDNPELRVI